MSVQTSFTAGETLLICNFWRGRHFCAQRKGNFLLNWKMERRQQRRLRLERHGLLSRKFSPKLRVFTSRKFFRSLLIALALIAILPPIYFHLRLRTFQKVYPALSFYSFGCVNFLFPNYFKHYIIVQVQSQKCSWLRSIPLVCAHGGDSSKAFPNTVGIPFPLLVAKLYPNFIIWNSD